MTLYQTLVYWSLLIFATVIVPIVLFPLRFFPAFAHRFFDRFYRAVARVIFWLMPGVKLDVKIDKSLLGKKPGERRAVFAVMNHPGLIDAMAILSFWPVPIRFFLADVYGIMAVGRLFAVLTGYLPLGKQAKFSDNLHVVQAFKDQADLLLFTSDPQSPQVKRLIELSGRPLLMLKITGSERVLPKRGFWLRSGKITITQAA